MTIDESASDLQTLIGLQIASYEHPNSKGLISLESKLFGTSCISTEGLGKTISNRYNRFVDKVIVKLNQVAGIFTQLTNEEKMNLKRINNGEMSSKEVSLPISRRTIGNFLKFIGIVLAWVSMSSLTKFITTKFKAQRLKDEHDYNEKKQLQGQLSHFEKMLNDRDSRLENRQASKEKMGMFAALAKAAHSVKDTITRTKWDDIERTAEQTRAKLSNHPGASDLKLNVKSVFRSTVLGAILAAWIGMTVWLVNKVVTFFKKISAKFGGESTTHESSDDDHDLYGNGY